MIRKYLLICGILSSLFYIAMNAGIPLLWREYDIPSQTVSELSAIDAPTRTIWVICAMLYILLFAVFGIGVRMVARQNMSLKITGTLVLIYGVFNIYWPPMHLRGNAMALTDILHIAWSGITLLLMILLMSFGARALRKHFRRYTIFTFIVFLVFGILTGLEGPDIAAHLPTPYIGIWERVNIGAFMVWVITFSAVLLRREASRIHQNVFTGQMHRA